MMTEKEKLKEAVRVAKMREQGMTYQEIANELGIGKSTAHSRYQMWKKHIGSEPVEEEEAEEVKEIFRLVLDDDAWNTIRGTVAGVLGGGGKKPSRKLGQVTGADLVTLKNAVIKAMREGLTSERIKFLYENIEGIREGVEGGDKVSKEVLKALPSRKSVDESEEEKKEEKVAVTVGGESGSEEKKKKKKEKAKEED